MNMKLMRYHEERFRNNNRTLLIVAVFLFVEQLFYGFLFTDAKSLIGRIHLSTSVISFAFMILIGGLYLLHKKGVKAVVWMDMIQYFYVAFGLGVSIYRAVYVSSVNFSIPVIYIAVLYGSAFLFYYPPLWSLVLYISTSLFFILLSRYVNASILYSTFIQDILVNNFLAWIASAIAYKRFIRQIDSAVMIEEQNEELKQLSSTDCLTQIDNRRKIDDSLELLHIEAKEKAIKYSVVLADIDLFKRINDEFGHAVGDEVLKEVTGIFKMVIGDTYMVGRWGGEEFMVLCRNTELDQALALAETIRRSIENYTFMKEQKITCSFGVSCYEEGIASHEVVKYADDALYISKDRGRNQVSVVQELGQCGLFDPCEEPV